MSARIPCVPTSAAALLTLRSPPSVTEVDQIDRLPDSKLSAKIKSGSGVFVGVDVNVAVGVLVAVIVGVTVGVGVGVFVNNGVLVGVDVNIAVGVNVAAGVPVVVGVAVAVGVCVDDTVSYSTWSKGAPTASPLYALAVRWPVPVI